MIILIEGPDGSGKTTLANKIQQQTGYTLLHRSYPKTEEEKANMKNEYMEVIKSRKNIIMDRCWYSEMAYGPAMRGETNITYPDMYELEKAIVRYGGGMVIYCTGPINTLWQRCISRGEDYVVDKDTYREIYTTYETVMEDVPHIIPVVTYEYKDL